MSEKFKYSSSSFFHYLFNRQPLSLHGRSKKLSALSLPRRRDEWMKISRKLVQTACRTLIFRERFSQFSSNVECCTRASIDTATCDFEHVWKLICNDLCLNMYFHVDSSSNRRFLSEWVKVVTLLIHNFQFQRIALFDNKTSNTRPVAQKTSQNIEDIFAPS